jgi:SAM-dependent methyltransferase
VIRRLLAAPFVLIPARFQSRRVSDEIYRKDYDRRAATYDAQKARDEMGRVTQSLFESLPAVNPRKILDLGCGTGHSTRLLAERFPASAIDAVDISPGMLKQAQALASNFPNVRFHLSEMEEFLKNSSSASYDLIACMWALGYARPLAVLRQVARVLAPGGLVVAVVNTRSSLSEIQDLWARVLLRHPFYLGKIPRIGFPRGPAQFARCVRRAGLRARLLEESSLAVEFPQGGEFVEWLRKSGQSAGLEGSLRPGRWEPALREIQSLVGSKTFRVTHRFLKFIGISPAR